MESVYLQGSEDVRRAASTISSAAEQIDRAAQTISGEVQRLEHILEEKLQRFEAAVEKLTDSK